MKKITFKQLTGKWRLTIGAGARERKDVATLYTFVERKIDRFLASSVGGKTAVKVIYGDSNHNESVYSNDKAYLLYTLGCFLEDYFSDVMMGKIEKKYAL